jgi:transcriptional regulator with XRE-family HTH domain
MTSTELSEKAGVRIAYLSEVEHDRTIHPQEEFLEKLADALNVPLEDILGRRMPLKDGATVTTPSSKQSVAGQGNQKESPAKVASGQQLRRRRSGALSSDPIEWPPSDSQPVEDTTVGQEIDEVFAVLSQEERNRMREILVPLARELVRLRQPNTGG